MNNKIWLSKPHMGSDEQEYVREAFKLNWVAPLGPHVDGFEEKLTLFTGIKHAAVLSSGTAAMHLALILLGVTYGDEVICQSFTFAGSANPIVYQGATPVFVDSENDTWNIDPDILEEAIRDRIKKGKKPKAIIVVHLYGMPAKLIEIMPIGKKYEIPVIEDAAEALGSFYQGTHVGSFGEMAVLSFNGNKIITTSGGGALLSFDSNYISKARFLATQARDNAPHYEHSQIGYNYRMSNICAAIGMGQMSVLSQRIIQKKRIYNLYRDNLSELPGIEFNDELIGSYSNRWLTTIIINPKDAGGITREDIRKALLKDNIESRPLWKPMHLQPVFKDVPFYGMNVSGKLFDRGLCLPSGTNLSSEEMYRIIRQIAFLYKKEPKNIEFHNN
ncbi:MAG: aminotransferase class I/II-fold pyridoxal phosphate-dependent enzyme [Ignavibacteria bacterium]|jgi:dTDP-4-amino-4,6-dideoxygalactose transaminase